ncbi:MAG: alkyl hydroperoxide reductase, partial [Planctomycetaceae bacterium]
MPRPLQIHLPMLIALFAWLSCPQSSLSADAEKDSSAEEVQSAETADEKLPEGHSNHGEIFNEGPRQAAYLMDGVGRISFGVTSDLPKAVAFVVQGVGQLHGFWYFESERSFRQAAAIDPQCAIAYWGMAMSNRKNADRAKGFISRAMELKDDASRREQLYIEAFDRYINAADEEDTEKEERAAKYIEDLEDLLFEFPDDIEAKAFLCEFQWSARRDGLEFNSYLAVDALIQQIHAVEPLHPAHHYRIHLWDRKKAEMALEAAAHCGPAAPAIAHMWHMPGHIYSRLHRYHDAVWQQEASARVDHAHMMKDMVLPDQIHNFAHNNEWCIRNLIHIGRVHDAIDLAKNMIELPRHPEYNHIEESGSYKYGRQRLLGVLQTFELHEDLIRLADSSWLQHTGDETADLAVDRALAAACVSTGRVADAESVREKLSAQLEELKKPQPEDADDADKTTVSDEKDEKDEKDDEDDEAIRKAADAAKKKHDT